jgi:hypothetical protein
MGTDAMIYMKISPGIQRLIGEGYEDREHGDLIVTGVVYRALEEF